MYQLVKINLDMGLLEYDMYQDIPKEEIGSSNFLKDLPYEEFKSYLERCINDETNIDSKIDTTTNRYILYVDNYPVGEIGIRTTPNDYWMNKGSQIFYKIRLSERNKGYGTEMLKLALVECKRLGFKKICLNCNDNNYASQKVILNNGGVFLYNYGTSSRYKITL